MTERLEDVIAKALGGAEVELNVEQFEGIMKLLNPEWIDTRPDYNGPIERTGTRAERSAANRMAHRIIQERRDEEAREAREARRAETKAAKAKSRPRTLARPSTAEQRRGVGRDE
jgi:hypothetical protein